MSMMITAKDNDKVKYTKSLLKSKNRNKESKFGHFLIDYL